MAEYPVEPRLFAIIEKYSIQIIEAIKKDQLNDLDNTPAIAFCQSFFIQFLRNVAGYKVRSFSLKTKKEIAERRLEMKDEGANKEVLQLLGWAEKFCDDQTDLAVELSADEPADSVASFHQEFLPGLLKRAGAWARSAEIEPLVQAIDKAEEEYGTALVELDG